MNHFAHAWSVQRNLLIPAVVVVLVAMESGLAMADGPDEQADAAAAGAWTAPQVASLDPPFAAGPSPSAHEPDLHVTVVTASRYPTELLDAPVAISVVDREEIRSRPSESIAEILRDVPGVFVIDNTIPGMQRLRIRGEDARRALVLIDGQEISDHSSFGAPLLIDPSFIDHIEVVRGPHSTLFGSRAAAGVINIITRQAPGDTTEADTGASWTGASDGYRVHTSAAVRSQGFWVRAGAAGTNNDDRSTPQGTLSDTANDSTAFLAQAGWSGGAHDLRLVWDRYEMSSQAATPEELVDGFIFSRFLMDMPRRDRDKIAAFWDAWDLLPGLERLHLDGWWQRVDRTLSQDTAGVILPPTRPPDFYDYLSVDSDRIETWGGNLQTDWRPASDHLLLVGATVVDDSLDKTVDRSGYRTQGAVVVPGDLTLATDAGLTTVAAFAQETWSFHEGWQLIAGLRFYHVRSALEDTNDPALATRTDHDSRVVGAVALVWRPAEPLALRASWGQGYVYPTLLHLHTGSLFGQGNITRPNPNLKPETSDNYELGARWEGEVFSADVAVFFNDADDYIASASAADVPGVPWPPSDRTYTNLDSARTWGAELWMTARVPDTAIEVYGNLTWLDRRLEFATFSTHNAGLPELSGRAGCRWERSVTSRLRASIDGWIAAGGRSRETTSRSTVTSDAWATLNLALGADFEIPSFADAWVGIEGRNLADESYEPSTDELMQPGRHLSVGVRMDF